MTEPESHGVVAHITNATVYATAAWSWAVLPKILACVLTLFGIMLYAVQLWERPTVRDWRRRRGWHVDPRNPED
jgi:hypothetical protein